MEIEPKRYHTSSSPDDDAQDAKSTPLRRAGQIGLAFINPFSDLMVIYRTAGKPAIEKLRILGSQLRRMKGSGEQLSWMQAVEKSGRPVELLQKAFRRKRIAWWSVMLVMGSLSALLLLMIVANLYLPAVMLIKAAAMEVFFIAGSLFSTLKVVEANYRLWQLSAKRVSLEERGTFQDYAAENSLWLQVVTLTALN